MDDKSPAKNLRQRTKVIEYQENKLAKNPPPQPSLPSTSSSTRKRKGTLSAGNCFCGKSNKSKLVYCYGPNCPWGWVHLKCLKLTYEPERVFCSEKCRDDEIELMNDENAVLKDYEWCSCRLQRGGVMIRCDKRGCNEWYHLVCVELETVPQNKWICPECKKKDEEKAAKKAAKRKPKKARRFSPGNIDTSSHIDNNDLPDIPNNDDQEAPAAVIEQQVDIDNNIADVENEVNNTDVVNIDEADHSEGYCICKKVCQCKSREKVQCSIAQICCAPKCLISQAPDDTMIFCHSPTCPHEFFHLFCMNLEEFPDPDDCWCCSSECEQALKEHFEKNP